MNTDNPFELSAPVLFHPNPIHPTPSASIYWLKRWLLATSLGGVAKQVKLEKFPFRGDHD